MSSCFCHEHTPVTHRTDSLLFLPKLAFPAAPLHLLFMARDARPQPRLFTTLPHLRRRSLTATYGRHCCSALCTYRPPTLKCRIRFDMLFCAGSRIQAFNATRCGFTAVASSVHSSLYFCATAVRCFYARDCGLHLSSGAARS